MTTELLKCFSGVKSAKELLKVDKQLCIEYVHFKEGKKRSSKGENRKVSKKAQIQQLVAKNCHEISERDSGIKRCRRQVLMSDAMLD